VVSAPADALPDDPSLLKAMVIAERLESERLRQIIREFQRNRFGRRAESLPEDQLELALEDAEQAAAADQAGSEQHNPAERKVRAARRRINAASCRRICRASRQWSMWRAPSARAVRA
jgi:hypothetical protein